MKTKMPELGVAPLIAVPSFLYLGVAIVLRYTLFPLFAFTAPPGSRCVWWARCWRP
jgi:hypothetical protein